MMEQRLKKDMHVEVTSDEDGFRGAWYVAKIIQAPKLMMDNYVQVEYNELVSEDDMSKKLTERVHVSFVRPLPPVGKGINEVIEVNDVVDAFFNDGWWIGVVDDVIDNGRKFVVYFDNPPHTMQCRRSDVRVHFDWVDGKYWEKPQKKKQDSSIHYMLSNRSGNSKRQRGRPIKQQAQKDCASTGIHLLLDNLIVNCPSLNENKSNDTEKKDNMDVPDEIVEKECIAEEVDMSVKEVEGALVPADYCKTLLKKDQKNKSRDRKMHTVDDSSIHPMLSNFSGNSKRQRGRPKKLQAPKDCASTGYCKTLLKKDQNKSRDRKMYTVDSPNASTKGDSRLKRKRGRPKLLLRKQRGEGSTGAKGSLPKTVMKDSCVGDEALRSAEKHCLILTIVDKPNEDNFQPLSRDSMTVTAKQSERAIVPFLENQADETVLIRTVKRFKKSQSSAHNEMNKIVDSKSRYRECDNASRGDSSLHEISHSKDADIPIDRIAAEINEDQVSNSKNHLDQPCSIDSDDLRDLHVQHHCANANGMQKDFGTPVAIKYMMELVPLQITDGSRDLPVKSLSHADSNDKGGELITPSASVCVDNVESVDNMENNESLPFLKGSSLWKNIESMEIFKKAAKKPHFSPLVKCKEEVREGLAIGHMVNFSNLVENISKLEFHHPITVIESKLETLAELESYGFDVEVVRACLTQLLSKKQREAELQKEYQDIGNTISYRVEGISKADEEIVKLNKKIRELSAKLDDTVSKKEMKESEISTLQSKQDVVGENLRKLQTDFENIAGTLL